MRRWCVWTAVAATAAVLVGCAAAPTPTWRLELRQAVEQASAASLEGRARVAEHHWRLAHQAASASGQAQALARVTLLRCAVEQAALVWDGCLAALPFLPEAGLAERAYAAHLGVISAPTALADAEAWSAALPTDQRPLARALWGPSPVADGVTPLLRTLTDPLSRLVAGGVAWRAGRLDPAGVDLMVETASAQGWRRPLAAWLAVQVELAERGGDGERAATARRRLDWVLQRPTAGSEPAAAPAR